MDNIFKRIISFFTNPLDSIDRELDELSDVMTRQREELDNLSNTIDELTWKEAMQRKKLKTIEDFLERVGLDVPPPELDNTETDDDETVDLLSIYASIIRKITKPIWEECEKAGTDAVDDLVKAVNNQMEELS